MSVFEKTIEYFAPRSALKRRSAKLRLRSIEAASRKPRIAHWGAHEKTKIDYKDIKTLRERSRHLTNNNPLGARALEIYATYIVGNGIIPHAMKNQKRSKTQDELLKKWADTTQIDIQNVNNLYGLQSLIIKHLVRDGEAFCQKILTREDKFPLKIKIIDAEFLDRSKHDKKTRNGVEYDNHGRPSAYWFFSSDPRDGFNIRSKKIPASDILHVINQDDSTLTPRPFLTAAMVRMYDLDLYQDFELQKQKLSSLFCGILREIEPTDYGETESIKELEAGSIIKAPPGFSVDFSDPPAVDGYSDFVRQSNMTIATALSIPYSLLASDFSESNYSSLKACYLSWFRFVEQKQNLFITQFCDNLFNWFLEACELKNIPIKGVKAIWSKPKKDILDVQKELTAYETGLRNNIFSLKEILRERGEDPDEVLEEISNTNKQLEYLGIKQYEKEEEWIE